MPTTLPRRQPGATPRSPALFDFGSGPPGHHGPERAGAPRRPGRVREPALDGLRGAAVLAVVLYHAGVGGATGGYLGVDAFFVLSGFLITRLLLDEWDRRGTIDLPTFWRRRLRRLVPPIVVLLAGVAALCLVLDPSTIASVRGDGIASLAYAMNWRLIAESSSYFDQFGVSPLRHAWSLAVEEQFYLLWPLLVLGARRLGLSARGLLVAIIGLAAASAAWMIVSYRPDADPSRLYYGTDTRAQALLVGAALAAAMAAGLRIRPGPARRRLATAAVAAGAVLLAAWVRVPGTAGVLYQGGFSVLALCVGLVVLACTALGANPVRTVLSFAPLRALGLVSYGVYLYHFPIFIWLNAERTGLAAGGAALLGLRLGVTLAAAVVSYVALERPLLDGRPHRLAPSTALGPALGPAAVVSALALLGAATARATPGVAESLATRPAPIPAARRTAGSAEPARTPVLLVGDSVAYSLALGLEGPVSAERGLSVWNDAVLFCELLPYARHEGGLDVAASHSCDGWEDRWRRDVAEFRPELTVLQVGAWEIFDRIVGGRVVPFGSAESDHLVDDALERAVAALSSRGAPVAVVTTPPLQRDAGTNSREWTQNETARTDHFNQLLRALAARHPGTVRVVDLAGHLCPANACRDEIGGVRVRADGVHFGPADAPVVGAWLADRLREQLPPPS